MTTKKKLLIIISIFLIGLVIIGSTYAFWTWTSNTTKNVIINTSDDIKNYIVYDDGESTFSGNFEVSNSYNQGMHATISIYKTNAAANVDLTAIIHMDVKSIGTNMANSSALKWVVTSGTYNNPGSVLAQGNFINVSSGDTLTLVPNIEVTTTETFYTVWIWLDANENPSSNLTGETLDTVVWTEVNQTSGVEDRFKITQINTTYQQIKATVIDNRNTITNYAVTTTETEPSTWVDIPSNEQNNVYNFSYVTPDSGTYYIWFKDSENKITHESVMVNNVDSTAPTCTWGTIPNGTIYNGETATITLTCTDSESNIIGNLTTSDITVSSNALSVTNVLKESTTNGYIYTLTLMASNVNTATLTLPSNKIHNTAGLGNASVTSSTITVPQMYTITYDNNYTLNPLHGASWTSDSLVFDGVDDWVNLGWQNYTNYTIEAKLKIDAALDPDNNLPLVSNYEVGGFGLSIVRTKPRAMIYGTTTDDYIASESPNSMPVNQIVDLVGTFDGTNLKFYIDGVLINDVTVNDTIKTTLDNTIMAIGMNPAGSEPWSETEWLDGNVYNVKLYNRALTQSEITKNYNGGVVYDGLIKNIDINHQNINTVDIKKAYGGTLGTQLTPERPGYQFDGWFTAASGGTEVTSSTPVPSSDTTYYAHWTQTIYTVTLDAGNGTLPAASDWEDEIITTNSLPSTYHELEYIESEGDQYIDTLYTPGPNTGVEITYKYADLVLQQRPFGITNSSTIYYYMYINYSGNLAYCFYDYGNGSSCQSTGIAADTDIHTFKMNVTNGYYSVDNGANTAIVGTLTQTSATSMYIFSNHYNTTYNMPSRIKLYAFRIYESGTLVRNYVPCYRVSDGEVGLYETEQGAFYTNQGAGSLIRGVNNETKQYNRNTTFGTLPTPTRAGYDFAGWNTQANGNGTTVTSSTTVPGDTTLYAQWTGKTFTATYYYQSDATSGNTTISNTTASCTVTNDDGYCTVNIPSAVLNSGGTYNNAYVGVCLATGTMTAHVKPDDTTMKLFYTATYYSLYRTDVTNYYYDSSYTSRTIYRNQWFTSTTAMSSTVLSTSTTGKSNYSTATGPGSSVWYGLSTGADTTREYSSVSAAAQSTSTTLYSIYTFNINYEAGTNVSSIGSSTGDCRVTTSATNCSVTLPTITASTGYTSVGWSDTNGATTGTAAGGSYNVIVDGTTLYANATDQTGPTGSVTATLNGTTVNATVAATDNGSGLATTGTYGWKISSSSTCNSTVTGFTTNTNTSYNFTGQSAGNLYVCVKVADKAGNYGYISTKVNVKVYMKNYGGTSNAYRASSYLGKIQKVMFVNNTNNTGAVASWDVSENTDNKVIAWVAKNASNQSNYDLYIGSNYSIYAKNLAQAFAFMENTGSFDFNLLNTSETTDMYGMFSGTCTANTCNTTSFYLNLGGNYDTRNVTNMAYMFSSLGQYNSNLNIPLNINFSGAKVINAEGMFKYVGGNTTKNVTINLGNNFSLPNAVTAYDMFYSVGNTANTVIIKLGNNFNLKSTTNVNTMFSLIGTKATNSITIDLGNNFNLSNATSSERMFTNLGNTSPKTVNIQLGNNFNASKVSYMDNMFAYIGRNATNFTLNLGPNFNTLNVTIMYMTFAGVGSNTTNFNINLGNNFNMSKVIRAQYMFWNLGNKTTKSYILNLAAGNFANITSYSDMFNQVPSSKVTIYVKDSTARSWITGKNSTWGTSFSASNVLIK